MFPVIKAKSVSLMREMSSYIIRICSLHNYGITAYRAKITFTRNGILYRYSFVIYS